MKFAVAKKIGMTRIFNEHGEIKTVTLVSLAKAKVSRIIESEKCGYNAVQVELLGRDTKSQRKRNIKKYEFREDNTKNYKVGDEISFSKFERDEVVSIEGRGKGKGFAGVIKRHGFSRGPETHGSDHHRKPGSIGGMYPQRVVKGKKMPGRLGHKSVSLKNTVVEEIDTENNILALSGSIPGPKGSLIKISGTGEVFEEKEAEVIEMPIVESEEKEEKDKEEIKIVEQNKDTKARDDQKTDQN